jgi:hypothetical protein
MIMDANTAIIVGALITVSGDFAKTVYEDRRDRSEAPAAAVAAQSRQPAQMSVPGAAGTYRFSGSSWSDVQGEHGLIAAPLPPAGPARRTKISRSMWWGILGCLCAIGSSFGGALIFGAIGIILAVRDIRSASVRRLARWGLAACILALVIAVANPHTGFMPAFVNAFDSSRQ